MTDTPDEALIAAERWSALYERNWRTAEVALDYVKGSLRSTQEKLHTAEAEVGRLRGEWFAERDLRAAAEERLEAVELLALDLGRDALLDEAVRIMAGRGESVARSSVGRVLDMVRARLYTARGAAPGEEPHVEIGGQRMTEAQFHAARRPLLDGVASEQEADRLREVWGRSDWDGSDDSMHDEPPGYSAGISELGYEGDG